MASSASGARGLVAATPRRGRGRRRSPPCSRAARTARCPARTAPTRGSRWRKALQQRREAAGGAVELAARESRPARRRSWRFSSGSTRELAVVDRDLLRLDLADALVDALLDVGLLALQLGDVARQLLRSGHAAGRCRRAALDLRFRSSRLRLSWPMLSFITAICSAWRARACSLLCSSCLRSSRMARRASSSSNMPAWAGSANGERTGGERGRAARREDVRASRLTGRPSARRGGSSPTLPRSRPAPPDAPCRSSRPRPGSASRPAASATSTHRLGAPLAEREVVLAAAALVGVALDRHLAARGWPSAPWRWPRSTGRNSSLTT